MRFDLATFFARVIRRYGDCQTASANPVTYMTTLHRRDSLLQASEGLFLCISAFDKCSLLLSLLSLPTFAVCLRTRSQKGEALSALKEGTGACGPDPKGMWRRGPSHDNSHAMSQRRVSDSLRQMRDAERILEDSVQLTLSCSNASEYMYLLYCRCCGPY